MDSANPESLFSLAALALTFFLGPVGLLLYFLIRATLRGTVTASESSVEE